MTPIINGQGLWKTYGTTPLFRDISFTISEGDRIGVIGPNGSGKSTLLQILCGLVAPDTGDVAVRKRSRVSYVAQNSNFEPGATVESVIEHALEQAGTRSEERPARLAETLGRAGFTDFQAEAVRLSGGWQKRLAIAEGLVQKPDILFLDEPTNHLDLAGIKWLEGVLETAPFACIVVSHDRYLLEHFGHEIVELNRIYEEGLLRVQGNYSSFLEAKEEYLHAQGRRQESLENRVHNELLWLRRGARARRTKAKAQIKKANELIGGLSELNERTRTSTVGIEFSTTERRTKKLIELEDVRYSIGDRTLFQNLDFTIKAGMRVGLVGPNGSGKTTLLRLLCGELEPAAGIITRADHLRIQYFDQIRELDPAVTLRRALAPDSDSVVYQDRVLHVASWAARFLFDSDDLNQPVGRLSGGERARVLVAQLMLQPADILLLDEPTNDLDIPTLEVLEESLREYAGTVVLVTHDRYMMDRVCTTVLGLDGLGEMEDFADYAQWEEWQRSQQNRRTGQITAATGTRPAADITNSPAPKKKLSYIEAREYASIEARVADAEQELKTKLAAMEDPAIASDGPRLQIAIAAMEEAQKAVDHLYSRWAELEEKKG